MFRRALYVLEPALADNAALQQGLAQALGCCGEVVFFSATRPAAWPAAVVVADSPGVIPPAQWDEPDDTREVARRLHVAARAMAEDMGMLARSVISSTPPDEDSIVDAARLHRCDIILIHGERRNAVVRLLNGSVIPGLVTTSTIPVLVVPPHAHEAAGTPQDQPGCDRVLVVLEDGDVGELAMQQGMRLAEKLRAELLFVHVMPADVIPMVDVTGMVGDSHDLLTEEIRRQSFRMLAAAVSYATRSGMPARGYSLASGTSGRDLAALATEWHCGLIVLAHRGSNAVMRLIQGSPIPGLITATDVPLLISRTTARNAGTSPHRRRRTRRRVAVRMTAARADSTRAH